LKRTEKKRTNVAAAVAAALVVENINISQAWPKPKPENGFVGTASHTFSLAAK